MALSRVHVFACGARGCAPVHTQPRDGVPLFAPSNAIWEDLLARDWAGHLSNGIQLSPGPLDALAGVPHCQPCANSPTLGQDVPESQAVLPPSLRIVQNSGEISVNGVASTIA